MEEMQKILTEQDIILLHRGGNLGDENEFAIKEHKKILEIINN